MKILICDDDQAMTSLIRFKLERENFTQLFVASNGDRAMRLLKDHTFDLLITDIHMPYHNGDEVMHLIKSQTHEAKVIMISGDDQEEVKTLAKKQGVLHFLTKPFDIQKLVKLVKGLAAA